MTVDVKIEFAFCVFGDRKNIRRELVVQTWLRKFEQTEILKKYIFRQLPVRVNKIAIKSYANLLFKVDFKLDKINTGNYVWQEELV